MNYAIFGPGRVGSNMAAYLSALGHEVALIARAEAEGDPARCAEKINAADIVAAALPDGAIAPWRAQWRAAIGARPAIHFSGALTIDGMIGYHPLYSFPPATLRAEEMAAIAFACPQGALAFAEIFPGAENPTFVIEDEARALYHALAVVSGNFSSFLFNETAKVFAARFSAAPEEALSAYFRSLADRFAEQPLDSLTGPIKRRDAGTVDKNLAALDAAAPELAALYRAFLQAAWPDYAKR